MNSSSTLYKKKGPLVVFLVPAFLFLILYLYYPFVQNIINSFSDITGLGAPAQGLNDPWWANYATLFTDPKLRTALGNTVILTVCTVVFQVGIALVLALLVDSIRVGAQLFRTLYFFPIVISATALGLMFNLIFLYNGGMLNQLLANLGLWDPAMGFSTAEISRNCPPDLFDRPDLRGVPHFDGSDAHYLDQIRDAHQYMALPARTPQAVLAWLRAGIPPSDGIS